MTRTDLLAALDGTTGERVERALELLAAPDGVLAVAISGGVDSAVLAALARMARPRIDGGANPPDPVLAVIGVSPSVPEADRADAREVARHVGVPLIELPTGEFHTEDYVRNSPDRCFHCRDELFTRIEVDLPEALGVTAVAYGEIADDRVRTDRPGARAAAEHGVLAPLAEAGLTKVDVRRVAELLGLPVADKPAAPCLASRVPFGTPVTVELLGRVEQAERRLRDLGLGDLRVRAHGELARVELEDEALAGVLAEPGLRRAVVEAVRAAGFAFVTVDLLGLQSGRFAALADAQGPHAEREHPHA